MEDKIYLRNTDIEDREKRNRIFNPETGISEDGTMHDGVYRPWINKPKKEQKMNREEAIEIVQKLLKTNRLDGTGLSQVWDFFKQPPTLAAIKFYLINEMIKCNVFPNERSDYNDDK